MSTKRDDHGINEVQNLLNEYPGAINEDQNLHNEYPGAINEDQNLHNEYPGGFNEDQNLINEYPGAINEDQNLINEYPGAIKFLPFCTQNNNAVTVFHQKMTGYDATSAVILVKSLKNESQSVRIASLGRKQCRHKNLCIP